MTDNLKENLANALGNDQNQEQQLTTAAGIEESQQEIPTTINVTANSDKTEKLVNSVLFEKSQSLVDIANNTFKELCRTLEHEQTKLLQLEERRKHLQEEMMRLKQEIEEEKNTYKLNFIESETDNNFEATTSAYMDMQSGKFNIYFICYIYF